MPSTRPALRSKAPWGATAPTERSRLLHALADAVAANRKELAELEARNVGKAISQVKAELFQGVENLRFYGSAVGSIGGRSNPIGGSLLFYSLKEPVGVAGQIVPWNYPLMMTTWKLAPALAAGCAVVLKPDPATPLTALRLAELATEVGFPPGAVNVVPGDGPTTGAHLVRHPGVDKVAFTGSTATGSEIMRLCSEPIKRLTLELGGKSPNLVFADADLADAIPSAVWSIFYASGQSCEARSRILVESSLYDDFVAQFADKASALKVGDPLDAETQMGSLISTAHRDKVHGFVERARADGAEVVTGGEPAAGDGAFYPPTVVAGVDSTAAIAQEEVFGPVVTVIPFEDEKDAVRIANDVQYGLFATVWTSTPPAATAWRARSSRARSGSTRRTRLSRACPSAGTSSPASAASSASRRSSSTSRRRASSSPRAASRSTRSTCSHTCPAVPLGRPRGGNRVAVDPARAAHAASPCSRRRCATSSA